MKSSIAAWVIVCVVVAAGVIIHWERPKTPSPEVRKFVSALLSTKEREQPLFEQLAKSQNLDQVITELEQRAKEDPHNPEIPVALGEAELNEIRIIRQGGGFHYKIGILAMEADRNFNAALKIDPSNWEAQFYKADSMYHWPASAGQDSNVVQRLTSLIGQQETMTPLPQFAQTYVVLGDEYQKIGQSDKAQTTWRDGLAKFPDNSTLQQRINHP